MTIVHKRITEKSLICVFDRLISGSVSDSNESSASILNKLPPFLSKLFHTYGAYQFSHLIPINLLLYKCALQNAHEMNLYLKMTWENGYEQSAAKHSDIVNTK
jgi:hypothetical protein